MNEAAICRNCGAGLAGRYCSNCGQTADVHVPSIRELLHEVVEGLTHSDSRIWSTLKCLLFQPGKLTQEFVAGRRTAYLPPFRLYLIMSVVFFLPLIAFLHMLMYWRPRHRYAVDLLFFLHLHAFFFVVATLLLLSDHAGNLWPALAPLDRFVSSCLFWLLFVYSVIAMRRVFQMGWALTLVKASALFFIYVSVLGLTVAGVFIYAALQL